MKRISPVFLIFFIFCCKVATLAQQDQLRYVYPSMPLSINPAYAGSRETINITSIYRRRPLFTAPALAASIATQQYVSFDMPTQNNKMGYGFQAFNANNGNIINLDGSLKGLLGLNGNIAYRVLNNKNEFVSLGGQLGLTQIPNLLGSSTSTSGNIFKSNMSLGLLYQRNGKFSSGVSFINVFSGDEFCKPIILQASYLFDIYNNIKLKAGVVLNYQDKYNEDNLKVDFNGTLWFNEKVGLGFNYLNSGSEINRKAMIASIDGQISRKLRLGYNYDFCSNMAVSQNTNNNITIGGFHQIVFKIDLDAKNGKFGNFKYF
ncbi:MAG: PorP/SprF family type IX secretion system membrane protein [Pseudarcicella sp.]|nr:PorP/SprF family type IX secretion system membrane protein [Pseudarcicella sp.]MBP6410818.1 PorP/SprF family type IX secretion system membrane protein [Pseudarcicella sp.]